MAMLPESASSLKGRLSQSASSSEYESAIPACLTAWQSRRFKPLLRLTAFIVIQAFLAFDLAWASGSTGSNTLRVKAAKESEVAAGLEERLAEVTSPDQTPLLSVASVTESSPVPRISSRPTIWSQRTSSGVRRALAGGGLLVAVASGFVQKPAASQSGVPLAQSPPTAAQVANPSRIQKRAVNEKELDRLIKDLEDPYHSDDVRIKAAAIALGKIKDPRAVPALIQVLEWDSDESVRRAAAEALVRIGKPAVEPLLKDIAEPYHRKAPANATVRYGNPGEAPAEALVKIGKPAVGPLITALTDRSESVQQAAAEALGKIGDPKAVGPLITALTDRSESVQQAAAEALDKLGWKPSDVTEEVSYYAAKGDWNEVIKIKDSRAVPALIQALGYYDDSVQRAAAEALGKLRDRRAVDALVKALKGKPYRNVGSGGNWGGSTHYISNELLLQAAAEALGQIGDERAIEPLMEALTAPDQTVTEGSWSKSRSDWGGFSYSDKYASRKIGYGDLRRSAEESLVKVVKNSRHADLLAKALSAKSDRVRLAAIRSLGETGDTRAISRLQFIASNQFKNPGTLREAAQAALWRIQAKVSPEEWEKIRGRTLGERTASLLHARFIKGLGIGSLVGGLLYGLFAMVGVGLIAIGIRSGRKRLPFFGAMKEVVRIKRDERIDRERISKILKFGIRDKYAAGGVLVGLSIAGVTGLILYNFIYTWLGAIALLGGLSTSGLWIQSDRGVKKFRNSIDTFRTLCRFSVFPITYLNLSAEYEHSGADTPEQFYLLRQFKKEQGQRIFGDLEKAASKFRKSDQRQILGLIVDLAYRMSKQNKNFRDLLEIQAPVAIAVSENAEDFKANLGIVEEILSGSYDLRLVKDRQAFKAFFEKVGGDLKPFKAVDTAETIGLLEKRLQRQGFHVPHFYNEVFRGMDAKTLQGSMDIILEIVDAGFFPTKRLIEMAKASEDRRKLYSQWRAARRAIRGGHFDLNNPLHVEIEYSTFRRIVDNSRVVSEIHKRTSYADYLQIVKRERQDRATPGVDKKQQAELHYAAYEALRLGNFINQVKEKARSMGRDVLVIPNLSYGRFASIFIEGDLRLDDVGVAFAKIGSSQTHENPYYIDPRFIRSQMLQKLVTEKPVIIVVDGSMHVDRYPDAYQGYLNLAIALDDVISGGEVSRYAKKVDRDASFIRSLRGKESFKSTRKRLERLYGAAPSKDKELYSFYLWNPRGKALKTRSSWRERRGTLGMVKPMEIKELAGPAIIFVNSVLTHDDIPLEIKQRAGGIWHEPAYFDDKDTISSTRLLFRFDETGVHLADALHRLELAAVEVVDRGRRKRRAARSRVMGTRLELPEGADVAVDATDAFTPVEIRRLLDDLQDRNSKVRAEAAEKLGEIGGERVVHALKEQLAVEKNREVRHWIVSSLGLIGGEGLVDGLSEVLLKDRKVEVRLEAARALGKVASPKAIPALSKALKKERSVDVRKEAVGALRRIRGKEVLPPLLSALKEDKDPTIRSAAGEAYLDVGREDAVPEALNYLGDPDAFVRMMLAEGLGDLVDKRAVGALSKLLREDKVPDVRERAAWALGNIGEESARPALSEALNDVNEQVREMARFVLEKIDAERNKYAFLQKDFEGFIFDLDDTLALLGQPLPASALEKLTLLLKGGKQVAIITEEREENLEARVWSHIPKELRHNLHFFAHGGPVGFGFDAQGEKVVYFRYPLTAQEKEEILDAVRSEISQDLYQDIPRDYKVKVKIHARIRAKRKQLAQAVREKLKARDIDATTYLRSDKYIQVFKFDKVSAARYFLEKTGLKEDGLLIIGNKARSFGGDRKLLTSFPHAISVNVGSASPTIQQENPNVFQPELRNIAATEKILEVVVTHPTTGLEEVAKERGRGFLEFPKSLVRAGVVHIFDPGTGAIGLLVAALQPDPVVLIVAGLEEERLLLQSRFGGENRIILRLDSFDSLDQARAAAAVLYQGWSPRYYRSDEQEDFRLWLAWVLERYDIRSVGLEEAAALVDSLSIFQAA